jgi:imidazolonepropionase
MIRKLLDNANIFTPINRGRPTAGAAMQQLHHFPRGAILIENGTIIEIGERDQILARAGKLAIDEVIDAGGACVIPGFVDPHTHLCFVAPREEEFSQRLAGAAYLDILAQGGGILSSVATVRTCPEEELYQLTRQRALAALALGTTTVEIKSGYGLDTESELKMLRVIARVGRTTPLDVVATFLGAHAVPPEYRDQPDAYIELLTCEMLPLVARENLARQCDIFCEQGVFSIAQGRRLLAAAKALGFAVKIHADEVNDLGGAGLAAELSALSADHLLAAGDPGINALAAQGVVATLLPATAYSLRKPYARAREMIDRGVAVALASDCNPGSSYTESMPFVIGLAVLQMGLSPAEALTAATINGAYALGMADRVGSLTPGKQADFLLLDGKTPAILAFHAGVAPVTAVYKRGEKVSPTSR